MRGQNPTYKRWPGGKVSQFRIDTVSDVNGFFPVEKKRFFFPEKNHQDKKNGVLR